MLRLMDQEWNLSILMTERYTLGPLGDITLVMQASDLITRMLYHGNKKRVHVGNKIKLGMEIPMIESRKCNISREKRIELHAYKVHTITEVIVECVGVSTDLQVPLLIIDRRRVSIMSALLANRRVAHMFQTKELQIAGIFSIETGNCFG